MMGSKAGRTNVVHFGKGARRPSLRAQLVLGEISREEYLRVLERPKGRVIPFSQPARRPAGAPSQSA